MAWDECLKLEWRIRRLQVELRGKGGPKALKNERNRTSMRDNNILGGQKKKEALARSSLGV